ncbi:MAG: hypothetical protein AUK53_11750 [Betaproteobacteria bacterium CG2_30_59_46]|nr:MAG: hypothetical protein AUK53_11750 [Betaproteobacteria bacterium CG2_30_59_46]
MSRFIYTGPNSAVTLKVSDGKGGLKDQDVLFWNKQEVDLPADHEMVSVLIAQGYLKPVQVAPVQIVQSAETKAATDKSGKTK